MDAYGGFSEDDKRNLPTGVTHAGCLLARDKEQQRRSPNAGGGGYCCRYDGPERGTDQDAIYFCLRLDARPCSRNVDKDKHFARRALERSLLWAEHGLLGMAITNMDALVASLPGQRFPFYISGAPAPGIGTWGSTWKSAGTPSSPLATPAAGSGAVPTDADSRFQFTNPTAPAFTYVGQLSVMTVNSTTLSLADRLWANSGLSGTVTSAQTIDSVALTRPDANGEDTELWVEVYTTLGATPQTATVSYTNSSGTASRTGTASLPASAAIGALFPVTLQAGDIGVASVQSITLAGSTGTAGNFGMTVTRRIVNVADSSQTMVENDPISLGLPRVYDDAALMIACVTASTSNAAAIIGSLSLVQG